MSKKFTCPFTGLEFKATSDGKGGFYAISPIDGTAMHIEKFGKNYWIDDALFKYKELITKKQAAELLNVSIQRITQLINNPIRLRIVGKSQLFLKSDVLKYKENRDRKQNGKH